MKWFTLFLSLYVVVLSCLPCTDERLVVDQDEVATTLSSSSSDQHAPDLDLCSPLCICSCCGGFALTEYKPQFPQLVVSFVRVILSYQVGHFSQPSFSFWKPPRG